MAYNGICTVFVNIEWFWYGIVAPGSIGRINNFLFGYVCGSQFFSYRYFISILLYFAVFCGRQEGKVGSCLRYIAVLWGILRCTGLRYLGVFCSILQYTGKVR